jgi:DNA-binding PadR family transcriptional regulator
MDNLPKEISKHLPLTESTCYIMLALLKPLHGYAIMQQVETMSSGSVKLGPGTLYGALSTLESEGLIIKVSEQDRRKSYALTSKGRQVLEAQIRRSALIVENAAELLGGS